MTDAMKSLSKHALKAVNSLYSIFSRVKTKLLLFDRMVEPILLYCAEVVGIYNTDVLDRIQMKFCKKILGDQIWLYLENWEDIRYLSYVKREF
jgi:hypothetical protein